MTYFGPTKGKHLQQYWAAYPTCLQPTASLRFLIREPGCSAGRDSYTETPNFKETAPE